MLSAGWFVVASLVVHPLFRGLHVGLSRLDDPRE